MPKDSVRDYSNFIYHPLLHWIHGSSERWVDNVKFVMSNTFALRSTPKVASGIKAREDK